MFATLSTASPAAVGRRARPTEGSRPLTRLTLLFLLLTAAPWAPAQDRKEAGGPLPDLPMKDLADAYSNVVAADKKYPGRLVVVRGTIARVEKVKAADDKVGATLEGGDPNLFGFDDREAGQLDKLKRGDDVVRMGTCGGQAKGVLVFVSCRVATGPPADLLAGVWTDGRLFYDLGRDGKVRIGFDGGHSFVSAAVRDSVITKDEFDDTFRVQDLTVDTLVVVNLTPGRADGGPVALTRAKLPGGVGAAPKRVTDPTTAWAVGRSWVSELAFSPDGKTLATGEFARVFELRDVATGKALVTFDLKDRVYSLSFSPDGKTIAAALGPELWVDGGDGGGPAVGRGDPGGGREAAAGWGYEGGRVQPGREDGGLGQLGQDRPPVRRGRRGRPGRGRREARAGQARGPRRRGHRPGVQPGREDGGFRRRRHDRPGLGRGHREGAVEVRVRSGGAHCRRSAGAGGCSRPAARGRSWSCGT